MWIYYQVTLSKLVFVFQELFWFYLVRFYALLLEEGLKVVIKSSTYSNNWAYGHLCIGLGCLQPSYFHILGPAAVW